MSKIVPIEDNKNLGVASGRYSENHFQGMLNKEVDSLANLKKPGFSSTNVSMIISYEKKFDPKLFLLLI